MSDEDVLAYIRGGGSHFVSFADVPVMADRSTVGAALTAAFDRGTRGVVVRRGGRDFRFVTVDDLCAFQRAHGTTAESVEAPLSAVGPRQIPSADMTQPIAIVRADFEGLGVKVLFESGRAIGLLSEAEEWEDGFFQAPAVYHCPYGHPWGPPPPGECFCGGKPVA